MNYCNVDNIARQWPQSEALAFGNSLVTEPLQKVKAGQEKFREIVNRPNQSKIELIQNLDDLLCDRERHWPDPELQRRKPEWADSLCSICVKLPNVGYGTRLDLFNFDFCQFFEYSVFVLQNKNHHSSGCKE